MLKPIQSLALVSVLTALSSSTMAQSKINFVEYDLPNGLHVILHEDHSTPIVAVSVLYHVGSKNEDPNRTGFAHFFEHLLFEGTENIKRGEYMKMIQAAGGELNANTSFDRTFYYEILPSNQLELGLWMESERMLHPKIDEVGLETQRGVVKEEKKLRYDNTPYGHFLDEVFKNSFTTHPYRWMPIGEAQYIDQATLPEFIDFFKTFYVPNNATLSIAGDIDVAKTKQMIEKYFGDIAKGTKPIPRPNIVEPKQTAEKRTTYYDNVQLPLVAFAYKIPSQKDKEFYALSMLSKVLSDGKSSRFTKVIVDEKQKAVAAQAITLPTEDPGLAIMFSVGNAGVDADELEKAMDEEMAKVIASEITDEELEKVRNKIESDFASENSRMASIAENLANYHVYYGNANLINTEIEKYLAVTKQDILNAAKKYFVKENRLVLHYLPKK